MTDVIKTKPSRGKRFLKCLFITLTILFSLIVLLVVHENWSGARAWQQVSAQMTEAGVELDYRKLLPDLPAADQNFGAIPILAAQSDFTIGEGSGIDYRNSGLVENFRAMTLPDPKKKIDHSLPHRHSGNPGDFKGIRDAFSESDAYSIDPSATTDAEAILSAIHTLDPELTAIDNAANLPFAQLDLKIGDSFIEHIAMPLPHLNDFMNFQKLQLVRATAALQTGNSTEAMAALKTMRQIGKLAGSQPFLISNLVEMACARNMLTVIWLGMKDGAWSDQNLVTIQDMLRGEDAAILERLDRSMNTELCTMQIGANDFMKTAGGHSAPLIKEIAGGEAFVGNWVLYFVPDGIWDHNKANGCRSVYETGIRPLREKTLENSGTNFKNKTPRNFLAHITVPALQSITKKGFAMSTEIKLASTACAIERFKLAGGGIYPGKLEEIAPRFISEIPVDLFAKNSEPLKYRIKGDRYILYSIGANQIDDSGDQVMKSKSSKQIDLDKGDLVWRY